MKRRALCSLGLAALFTDTLAQAPAASRKPSASPWRFVINEAVTGETNFFLLTNRYQPLADFVTAQIKGRSIGIEPMVDIQRFMAVAQAQPRPELVFGKSVNQLAKLVRDHGYQPLVRRPDPYKAAFIVPKNSTIQSFAQLGGRKLLLPDESSATTAMAKAEIRRLNIAEPYMSHTRYQDTVAAQITSGLADAGVVNPTIARKWREAGGRILAETQPVINWSVLASPKASPDLVARMTESLLAMNTHSSAMLTELGVKQWARADKAEYLALLDYTGE